MAEEEEEMGMGIGPNSKFACITLLARSWMRKQTVFVDLFHQIDRYYQI